MLEGGGGLDWRRRILESTLREAAPAEAVTQKKKKEKQDDQERQEDDKDELPRLESGPQEI